MGLVVVPVLELELEEEPLDEPEPPPVALATPLSKFEAVVATPLTAPAAVVVTPLTTPDAVLPTGAGRLLATVETAPPAWVTPLATLPRVVETAPAAALSGEVVVVDGVVVVAPVLEPVRPELEPVVPVFAPVPAPADCDPVVVALGCAAVVACGVVELAVAVAPLGVVPVFCPPLPDVPVAVPPEWVAVGEVRLVGWVLLVGHAVELRRDLVTAVLWRVLSPEVGVERVRVRVPVVSVRLAGVAVVCVAVVRVRVAWVAVARRRAVAHAAVAAREPPPDAGAAPEVAEIWLPPVTAGLDGDRAAASLLLVAAVFAEAVAPEDSDGPATICPKLPR